MADVIDLTSDPPSSILRAAKCARSEGGDASAGAQRAEEEGPAPPHGRELPAALVLACDGNSMASLVAELAPYGAPDSWLICADPIALPRQQAREIGWSCGYENVRGILTALRQRQLAGVAHAQLELPPQHPSIRAVQALVAAAWRSGFDPVSAMQLQCGSFVGSRRWLGAPEALALLSSLRVHAWAVEIVERSGAGQALASALHAYARRTPHARRLPVLVQHEGHSRLAVGVGANGVVMLRDPADQAPGRVRCVPAAALDGQQFQLIFADCSRCLSDAEMHARKGEPQAAAIWAEGRRWDCASWFAAEHGHA